MAESKQTFYEILGVERTADIETIRAAHRSKSDELLSGESGLSPDEVKYQLQLLGVALNTLSAPYLREAYDYKLNAAVASANRSYPVISGSPHVQNDGLSPIQAAETLQQSYRTSLMLSEERSSLVVLAESAASSVSAMTKIVRVLAGLLVLFILFKGAAAIFMAGRPGEMYTAEKSKAEEKLYIQDYYQKHGVRPASYAEAQMLVAEENRILSEQRNAELEQRRREEQNRQMVEESRRRSDQISRELRIADEQAKAEAERTRREEEWKKQRQAEQARLDEQRARAEGERRTRQDEELVRQRQRDSQWRQTTYW